MSKNKIYTIAPIGLKGVLVEVEANFSRHLPKVILVGLPDASVQEARERVWAAIENSDLHFPRQKVVVNLAPAQIRKEGGAYDLSIAISILQRSNQLELPREKIAFIGELALSGQIKPVPGILVMVASLQQLGFDKVFVPEQNIKEAAIIKGIKIYPTKDLRQLFDYFMGLIDIPPSSPTKFHAKQSSTSVDLAEIKGQVQAKRVLEIAAAGGHNMLLVGPPGAGKSMLAKTFLSILPPLSLEEALQVSKIHSLAGLLSEDNYLIDSRLLRAPHHSASVSAMVGGGSWPRPGEISLSHHGVLFLDEILEFPRPVLEAMRQPLEDKIITVSRVQGSLEFPANFIMLATANPCPCGYLTDQDHDCRCSAADIRRYQKRLSGPLLDRIDLHLIVSRVKTKDLRKQTNAAENSAQVQQRIIKARAQAEQRFKTEKFSLNSDLPNKTIKYYCHLNKDCQKLLQEATERLKLSARGYFKMLKVARTIADLAGRKNIEQADILEAVMYRSQIFE